MKKTAVYGAGISGLIAAYFLQKEGCQVCVVDPDPNQSILQTLQTPYGPVERAANSILLGFAVQELLQDIGVEYFSYFKEGSKKYIFTSRGQLRKWPLTLKETFLSVPALWRLAKRDPALRAHESETVEQWGERVLTPSLLHNLFCLGLQGIYGKGSLDFSASLIVNSFLSKNKNPLRGSVSFPKGMGEFPNHLKKFLFKKGVQFESKLKGSVDFSIVSTPAHSLPKVTPKCHLDFLGRVSYQNVSTFTVFSKEKDRLPFKGFGCVFQKRKGILGLILNSDLFEGRAQKGWVSETWILDGNAISDQKIAFEKVGDFRGKELGVPFSKASHEAHYFKHWPRAFPKYNLDLEQALLNLNQNPKPHLHYFANWTGALGIGSMVEKAKSEFPRIIKKETI